VEQVNKYDNKYITIPNLLSMFRLCLVPVIVWLYCFEQMYVLTIIFIVISSLTDIIDGYIARKYNMISKFGKFIDPVADKLTQMAIILCLMFRFPIMFIPLAIILIKDPIVLIVRYILYEKSGEVIGANWCGKLATICIFIMIVTHLIWTTIPQVLTYIIVSVTSFVMILSGIIYIVESILYGRKKS